MIRYKGLLSIMSMILVLLAVSCAPAAPVPDERLGSLEAKVETLSQLQNDLSSVKDEVSRLSGNQPDTSSLETRLDDLQTRLDALAAEIETIKSASGSEESIPPTGQSDHPFDVAMAQFVLDSAGLHTMADTMSVSKVIDPAYLVTVNRAKKVLSSTTWPDSLQTQYDALSVLLNDLAAALQANDAEKAAGLAVKVHDAQHLFSQAVDSWLKTAAPASHTH